MHRRNWLIRALSALGFLDLPVPVVANTQEYVRERGKSVIAKYARHVLVAAYWLYFEDTETGCCLRMELRALNEDNSLIESYTVAADGTGFINHPSEFMPEWHKKIRDRFRCLLDSPEYPCRFRNPDGRTRNPLTYPEDSANV